MSLNNDAIPARREYRIATRKWLCPSTSTQQVLASVVILLRGQVVEEVLHIAAKVVDGVCGDEREDDHLAVGSLVQVPALASNFDRSERYRFAVGAV